jgi:uncharacterized protein YndB with AHSA1/START domain
VTEPLRLTLDVACAPEDAFAVWTERFSLWWPADHTVTGDPDLVALEPRLGGRIYERGRDGAEHEWGEVTLWDPPTRLSYQWHLRRDRADATEVEIAFRAHDSGTRVEIEHRGWERLGTDADLWRTRNQAGWSTLLPHYVTAIENSRTDQRGGHHD